MKNRSSLLLILITSLALSLAPAARAADIQISKVPRIEAPPAGKALINFHQIYRSWFRVPIFDENFKLVIDLPGNSGHQLVCAPGPKTFYTQVPGGGGAIQVIAVEAAADKTYDVVFFKARAKGVVPLTQLPDLAGRLAKIDKSKKTPDEKQAAREAAIKERLQAIYRCEGQRIYALEPSEAVTQYEASKRAHHEGVKRDFLGGPKSDRVLRIGKEAGR